MTSKVLVKLPVVPFSQRKKPPPEIIPLPSRNEDNDEGARYQGQQVSDKVTQLEQNMKYLQDQHQATLVALHQEVEILRQRNRDLQFQLVFSKGTNYASSPSSPEDNNGSGFTKSKGSPENINVAPLQVELLEKDLKDMRTSLNEAKMRNIYLSDVVAKQKKYLELAEKEVKEKQKMSDVAIQVDSFLECQQVELQARLDDAEALVKRLRQENEDQRKEIENIKSSNTYSNGNPNRGGSSRNRGSQSAYHNRGSSAEVQGQDENYHKFPPLQTQSYWHRASRGNHSYDHSSQSDYYRNSRHHQRDRQDLESEVDNSVLPQLRNGSVRVDNSSSYPPFFRSRGQHSGGNNYKDERGSRRYRGQKSQRDRRDQQDTREFHREYKDREPKENQHQHQHQQQQHHHNQQQQQREYSESAKSTRDSRNSQRQKSKTN